MKTVCFIQCHFTDEYFIEDQDRNPIEKLKVAGIFDYIVIGVADIPENHAVFDKYASQYSVDIFYSSSLDIVNRMVNISTKYKADLLSRILINWKFVDVDLIRDMLAFGKQDPDFDYCMVPYDFDIKFGCDLHTKNGLEKLNRYLSEDPDLHAKYAFRPWNLLENDPGFKTVIFNDVPEYSNTEFYKLRDDLLDNVPVSWDFGAVFYYHEYENAKDFIVEDDIVLDISCGQGNGSAVLAAKCRKVYAFDVESSYLEIGKTKYAEKFPTMEFILGIPGDPIPLPDESISFAVSIHTMEHVEDDAGFLQEIGRVLKPGGIFYLEVPIRVKKPFSGNSEPLLPHTDTFAGHYREYSLESFEKLVGKCYRIVGLDGVSRGSYVPLEKARNAVRGILEKQ